MDNAQKGRLFRHYGRRKMITAIMILSALVNLGLGGFILFIAIPSIVRGDFLFDGDLSIMYYTSYGLLATGGVILLLAFVATKPILEFSLYENAVECKGSFGQQTDYFEALEDLLIFGITGFAYRKTPHDEWIRVSSKVGKKITAVDHLTQAMINFHIKNRLDKLYSEFKKGNTLVFRYFPGKNADARVTYGDINLDAPTETITLSKHQFQILGKTGSINRIKIDKNIWDSELTFIAEDGSAICSIHPVTIISSNLFVELLSRVQKETAQG